MDKKQRTRILIRLNESLCNLERMLYSGRSKDPTATREAIKKMEERIRRLTLEEDND